MESIQESSGEMPVETRSAKRRREDSEVEGEGVAREQLPSEEKKAYRAALHKKWREALAEDHIGITPGTEKLKNFAELPPEVAERVGRELHAEFPQISIEVVHANLATYHVNLLRRNTGHVRIQMGTSPRTTRVDAEVILGIRGAHENDEERSPSPSEGGASHGQHPEPQSPAPQERGKSAREPASGGKTPKPSSRRGTPAPGGAPGPRRQPRKRAKGESASRADGGGGDAASYQSAPSHEDEEADVAHDTMVARAPSAQRTLFSDGGPFAKTANLDSAFAVLESILTELGKAEENVRLEAERAKQEAEAKLKAAEANKDKEAKLLEEEQRVAAEIARLTSGLAQATEQQKRLLDRAKDVQKATIKALKEAEALAETARSKEEAIDRAKQQHEDAKRKLKQIIDRI